MLDRLRPRLTFANVVSVVTLFVVLGGSAYAAVQLSRNAVKRKHIAPNAVTAPKVKNGSLRFEDFGPGQLPRGAEGAQGAQGQKGDAGNQGIQGATGADGDTGAPGSSAAHAQTINVPGGPFLVTPATKNVDRVTQLVSGGMVLAGRYCLHSTVTPNHVTATLVQGSAGEITVSSNPTGGVHCDGVGTDPGYNVFVNTFDSAGAPSDREFYVLIN
jgi:hypothetical protein